MKNKRLSEILRIINENEVETQTELAEHLENAGISAAQATISRDIRTLRLVKVPKSSGKSCYQAPEAKTEPEKYIRVLKGSVLSVAEAKNLIVLKTVPGMAMAAAAAIDEWGHDEIPGCIAGDDTVFCAVHPNADTGSLIREITGLLN